MSHHETLVTYPPVAVVHRQDHYNQPGNHPLHQQQVSPPQQDFQRHHRRHGAQFQRLSDPRSDASSRGSLSDSSSTSHPKPVPQGNLDPSTTTTPAYPEKAVTGSGSAADSGPFSLGPRVEEVVIGSDSAAQHQQPVTCVRTSWTAEGPFPGQDSHHPPRGYHHEGPDSVAIYTPATKEESSYREPNAVLVLVLLSAPVPILTVFTALYAFLVLLFVTLTTPLRLCASVFRNTSFSGQICQLLIPVLHFHERLAQSSRSSRPRCYHHRHHPNHPPHRRPCCHPYHPSDDDEDEDDASTDTSPADEFSPIWLITVHLLAPFLCLGLMLAVWTAAFFWIFAITLGNPDGTEKGDDGRAAVLGVNGWWQKWLRKSRKR
ncbi:hypothetical protein VTN31DRAFT_7101 [Thermomyces dupontii]|uniref:uncharacterized protein n=1 Tax=Talaromyces thermophilus TaxID=28565 RepID=UPI003744422F